MGDPVEPGSQCVLRQAAVRGAVSSRVLALAAAVAIVFASVPAATAEQKTVTLNEYVALLEAASIAAPEKSQALQELETISTVRLSDGTKVTVSSSWPAPGSTALKPRLDTTLAEIRSWQERNSAATGDPRLVAREITDGEEFHRKKSLIGRIKDAIDGFFRDLGGRELPTPDVDLPEAPANDATSLITKIILLAAVVVLAIFVWRRLRAINRAEDEEEEEEPEQIWDIGPADPVKLDAMASAAAAEGRYSDAVRAFYVANLLRLDEKGVIRFKASDTNGAFRRSLLRGFGPIVREFDVATLVFERVHYGEHVATAEDWEATRTAWQGLWTGVAA